MINFLSICSLIMVFLSGYGNDFPKQTLDKCSDSKVVSDLKEKIPSKIFKNAYEFSAFRAAGIDYETYKKAIAKHYNYTDVIEINSISNFNLNSDSCTAMINATLRGFESRKLWSVTYKVSSANKTEILDLVYFSEDHSKDFE